MRKLMLFVTIAALSACRPAVVPDQSARSAPAEVPPPATAPADDAAAPAGPAFAGKVWRVQSSSAGDPGSTYAFAADGTLVIDSPNGTPMQGQWRYEDGKLTIVEEGIAYPTDIVKLDAKAFQMRSHNPGGTVDITLVPAPEVPMPAFGADKATHPMPGSDLDPHGCKPSAGYTWCARTGKCERPWELAKANGFENTPEGFKAFCATR